MTGKVEAQLHEAEVDIQFEDAREEQLIRIAVVGQDAHEWLHTSTGRFVIGAAVQDQREIESKLVTLRPNTPWRRRKILELQQKHQAIELAVSWLTQTVVTGQEAERELNQPSE